MTMLIVDGDDARNSPVSEGWMVAEMEFGRWVRGNDEDCFEKKNHDPET
jgi:hypothetical protein